jgi:hypothetical protein
MTDSIQSHRQLNDSIDRDIKKRTEIHQAAIARLKSAQARSLLAAQPLVQPLVMLAHGDSWFDYPLSGNTPIFDTSDIIHYLKLLGNPPPIIHNISHHGDATTDEMSWPKQQRLINALEDPANWLNNIGPDAILFSGGGNDIAGDQFCVFLDYNTGAGGGLNRTRFDEALGMVEASYSDLIAFRDRFAPNIPIFAHCYDFALPNGVPTFCAGPWLKPSLDFCGWNYMEGKTIVHDALADFRARLITLQGGNNFTVVETQGLLSDSDWANELHPYPSGFVTMARQFVATLRAYPAFHGRI